LKLDESQRSASCHGCFIPGQSVRGNFGSWVDPRASLDALDKRKSLGLPKTEILFLVKTAEVLKKSINTEGAFGKVINMCKKLNVLTGIRRKPE
jgi:hypothetical protein